MSIIIGIMLGLTVFNTITLIVDRTRLLDLELELENLRRNKE